MSADTKTFSGLAVDDAREAQRFHGEMLGLPTTVLDEEHGLLTPDDAGDMDALVNRNPAASRPPPRSSASLRTTSTRPSTTSARAASSQSATTVSSRTRRASRAPGSALAWFERPAGKVSLILEGT